MKPNPIAADDYQPYADYLMLKPEQEAEKSEGGIIIPEQARKYLNEGKVLKVGPQVDTLISPGLFVTFEAASEYRLDLGNGNVVFVIKENSIILFRENRLGKIFPQETSLV